MKNFEKSLKYLLNGFVFVKSVKAEPSEQSFTGIKVSPAVEFQQADGSILKSSGIRHFYISPVMNRNSIHIPSHRYMIIWTAATIKPVHSNTLQDYELEKVIISGRTDEILLKNLRQLIKSGKI